MCIEKDCHLRRLQLSRSRESGGITVTIIFKGLLSWCSGEESASQCRRHKRHGFDSWVRKIPGGGNGNPLGYSYLGNPMHRGAWEAAIHGVAKSRTCLSDWAHTSYLSAYFKLGNLPSVYLTFFPLDSIKKGIIIQVLHRRTLKIREVKRCVQVQLS